MSLQNLRFSSCSSGLLQCTSQINRVNCTANGFDSRRRNLKVSSTIVSLGVGTDVIGEIGHNKALIAAAACAAVGQLAKPFTASILYRRDFDLKAAFQAGGFPSTHSSAAVATAMTVGLERGFSDSIFGLAVVYAALTMYDAQGVRREVGVHARTLNKVLSVNQLNTHSTSDVNSLTESSSKKLSSGSEPCNSMEFDETGNHSPELHKYKETLILTPDKRVNSSSSINGVAKGSENGAIVSGSLKEAIGHTEIEVAAGALLGLLGSLAVHSL